MPVRLVAGLLCIAALAARGSALAHDENVYLSLQGGRSFTRLTDVREVGGSFEPGTTAEQPTLKDANLYGAKFGVYSRSGVLGLEGEVADGCDTAGRGSRLSAVTFPRWVGS